jgi:hypothetical protein
VESTLLRCQSRGLGGSRSRGSCKIRCLVFLSVEEIVPMAGSTVILGYNGPDPYTRFNIPFLGLNGPYSRKLLFESTLGFKLVPGLLDYSLSFFFFFFGQKLFYINSHYTKFHLFVNHLLTALRLALVLGI